MRAVLTYISRMSFDRSARLALATTMVATMAVAGCSRSEPAPTAVPAPTASDASSAPGSASPAAQSTVLFEATGTGTAYTIDTDPAVGERVQDAALPWQSTMTIGPDVALLQVVVVGKNEGNDAGPGCRITLNGKVVAEEPVGGSAHCVYQMP